MIQQIINADSVQLENLLTKLIYKIHREGPVSPSDLEELALIKHFHSLIFSKYESSLLYAMGLFYKVGSPTSLFEEIYAIFGDAISASTGNQFTPVQADAYRKITDKQFFSFSAPTSAGKSHLFRELISKATGDLVIVVPSRALIAEYLNTVKKIVDNRVLVLQFVENINIEKTSRRIFVITPERGNELFKYKDTFNFELFLFDEAQLSEEEIRGIGFDAFVRRVSSVFPNATKVFAHPFIKNPEAQLQKHHLPEDDCAAAAYEQNTVGKVFIGNNAGKLFYFSPYADNGASSTPVNEDIIRNILINNGTILIYASKAKLYSKAYLRDYRSYLRFCPKLTNPEALKYVEQLREYIGANKTGIKKRSLVVSLMERGIVLHHGSMPLKMRLIIEQFVRENHARICFATSTLKQGINMPFDAVYIDNFKNMDVLTLKNLIGRSGRTTPALNTFEYGYTIVNSKNIPTFCKRIKDEYALSNTSPLDIDVESIDIDNYDLIDATKNHTFDDETRLTQTQMTRLSEMEIASHIEFILNTLFCEDHILTGREYYEKIQEAQRAKLKESFKAVFIAHLRRQELTTAEQMVLSTSIPILLWHIQGKTFKEVLALRYAFLTQNTEQRRILALARQGEITQASALQKISRLKVRFSQAPTSLPNRRAIRRTDFGDNTSVMDIDYDTLVLTPMTILIR